MKFFTALIFLAALLSVDIYAQTSIVQQDNGTPKGFYSDPKYSTFEETVLLRPAGPCRINKISIYLSGTHATKDTIRVVGDPASNAGYPPTEYVWDYNTLIDPIVVDYKGTAGWVDIDVSQSGLRNDGLDQIAIQHVIQDGGPYFTYDSDGQNPKNSFLNDAQRPNPNFYNIRGTLFSYAAGNFMVKLEVAYDFPLNGSSAPPPAPRLFDATKLAGLVDANGNVYKSELVTVADWNLDGFDDIGIRSIFYQNKGNGTFENVTSKLNITGAASTVWADVDNDGYMDCFALVGMGADKMYWGKADGTMEENTDPVIKPSAPGVTPMWLDYNHDGLPDLFIAYGRTETSQGETYFPDKLYKNLGNRKFQDVSDEAGISAAEKPPYYDCWSASICDFNSDNYPDVFVATYRLAPDLLHMNNHDGTFTQVGDVTGVQGNPTHSPGYFGHGMGSDWADFNNDCYVDLAVGNLGHPDERGLSSNPSLIFQNDGAPDFTFHEVHKKMGLKFFEMNAGIVWADLDLDGWQDIFHCQYSYNQKGKEPDKFSRVYINQGPDKNFRLEDKTWEFGSLIHGAWSPVRLDFDGDGDMDLLIGSSNENVKLFRNDLVRKGNWVSFRLSGNPSEKVCNDAFGSSVMVYSGSQKFLRQLPGSVISARSSQCSNELNFGLGNITKIDSVVITYPNGKVNKITNIEMNRRYRVPYMASPLSVGIAAPGIINPAVCGRITEADNKLRWSAPAGATSYRLEIKELPALTTVFSNTITENEFTAPGEPGHTYSWSVRALGKNDSSAWSGEGRYTIGNARPQTVALSYPKNDTANLGKNTAFTWGAATYLCDFGQKTIYHVQFSTDAGFNSIAFEKTGISTNNYKLDTNVFTPSAKYYWRVRAINEDMASDWSEVRSFTALAMPAQPVLTKPANAETNVKIRPKLEWQQVPLTDYYHVQVAGDEQFTVIKVENETVSSNSLSVLKALNGLTKYYWRVKAVNSAGESSWSEAFNFTTEDKSAVDDISGSQFEIFECNPNPLNNKSTVRFKTDVNGPVSLTVLDLKGREVARLVSQDMEAGIHQSEFDASALPSGTYYCRLESAGKTQTIKMAVVK